MLSSDGGFRCKKRLKCSDFELTPAEGERQALRLRI